MISIIKKSQIEMVILFNKSKHFFKIQLLNTIISSFPKDSKFLIEICGVDTDGFIEEIKSKTYLLEQSETNKFVKNLSKLVVLTDYCEDLNLFGKFIFLG